MVAVCLVISIGHSIKSLIPMVMKKWLHFRTTVRNGYNTVLLGQIYVNLRILTYIGKWDVPCLVPFKEKIISIEDVY